MRRLPPYATSRTGRIRDVKASFFFEKNLFSIRVTHAKTAFFSGPSFIITTEEKTKESYLFMWKLFHLYLVTEQEMTDIQRDMDRCRIYKILKELNTKEPEHEEDIKKHV